MSDVLDGAMQRALQLALRGWGRVAPNPLVGAVVLSGDRIVGEGYHAEFGGAHAEPSALAAAGADARGGTLVVTLEPCAHHGRQPPCTDAILAAGVRQVVTAVADPNPVASGGARLLRDGGITVEFGLRAAEAAAQNAAFLHRFRNGARPFVALKLATSLDGRIADAAGSSRWISGPDAREWVQWLRAGFDAIAVGAETARADDPSLTVRGALVPRRPPLRLVLGRSGHVPPSLQLVQTAREVPTVLVTAPDALIDPALEAAGATVLRADGLAAALATLKGEGVESILLEGGSGIAASMLEQGLVDRLYLVQSPVWLGRGAPMVADFGNGLLTDAERWHVVERRALGPDTLLVVDR